MRVTMPPFSELIRTTLRYRAGKYRRLPAEEDVRAILRTVPIGIICSDTEDKIGILEQRISNYERDHLFMWWDFDAYPYGTA